MTLIIVLDSGVEFKLEGGKVSIELPADYDILDLANDLDELALLVDDQLCGNAMV